MITYFRWIYEVCSHDLIFWQYLFFPLPPHNFFLSKRVCSGKNWKTRLDFLQNYVKVKRFERILVTSFSNNKPKCLAKFIIKWSENEGFARINFSWSYYWVLIATSTVLQVYFQCKTLKFPTKLWNIKPKVSKIKEGKEAKVFSWFFSFVHISCLIAAFTHLTLLCFRYTTLFKLSSLIFHPKAVLQTSSSQNMD